MRTNLRIIEIFVCVVEGGSFVSAARRLLVDPAVVSRAIKSLEEGLGTLLFTRSTRVLKLTADGERFYRDGAGMLRTFDETISRFKAASSMRRQLKIGMAPALSRRMLLRAIPSFLDEHPEVELTLVSINDRAEIGDEGIDVLVRPRGTRQRGGEHRPPQGLVVRNLVQSPLIVCASYAYLRRAGIPKAPGDLARHSCLALLTLERDVHDEWIFSRSGDRERIKFAPRLTAHGDELREAALAGCGVVRLLACHVEDELRRGALVRILADWDCLGGMPIVAVYRRTRPRLSPMTTFVEHLVREFRAYDHVMPVPDRVERIRRGRGP